jgi:hypothetical protein
MTHPALTKDIGAPPGPFGRTPGKLSVSVAATSIPAASNDRRHRLSCAVVLAVAGALAAVTVGSVFVSNLLSGGGDGDNSAVARPSGATSAVPTDEPTPPGDGAPETAYAHLRTRRRGDPRARLSRV